MNMKTHVWIDCAVVIITTLSSMTLMLSFRTALLKDEVQELKRINQNNQELWLSIKAGKQNVH